MAAKPGGTQKATTTEKQNAHNGIGKAEPAMPTIDYEEVRLMKSRRSNRLLPMTNYASVSRKLGRRRLTIIITERPPQLLGEAVIHEHDERVCLAMPTLLTPCSALVCVKRSKVQKPSEDIINLEGNLNALQKLRHPGIAGLLAELDVGGGYGGGGYGGGYGGG